MNYPLILGNFLFQSFEIPESFHSIGGKQAHSLKEFPGGIRTIRNLGFFPLPLDWSGYLFGANAFQRAAQLQRLVVAGNLLTLSYGPWKWEGEVVRFEAKPRHSNLVPYEIRFEPTKDQSGIGSQPQGSVSPENQVAIQNNGLTAQTTGTATSFSGYYQTPQ